jgi:PhzF family phenazine biosynthesis protein
MNQPISIVDAFALKPFTGNQAAVCILDHTASEEWMQSIAAEMNLAETAFLYKEHSHYRLRWFTPKVEVDLCGHATLASAHVLWTEGHLASTEVAHFETRSGHLTATALNGSITLDLPVADLTSSEDPGGLISALGLTEPPLYIGKSFDYLVHVSSASIVRKLEPDLAALAGVNARGIIVTAASDENDYDIVSRFFAPRVGINEDPVTGSAHCILAPYWSVILGKNTIHAYQASARGGELLVELKGDRVLLTGKAFTTVRGILEV